MSPTLLEFVLIIVLLIVAWQIGLAITPAIMGALRNLKRDIDEVADQTLVDPDQAARQQRHKEEHTNGTRS
jgi:hypothetical protein